MLPLKGDDDDQVGLTGEGDGVDGVEEAGEEDGVQLAVLGERPLEHCTQAPAQYSCTILYSCTVVFSCTLKYV